MPSQKTSYKDTKLAKTSQWDAAKYYFSVMKKWPLLSLVPLLLTGSGSIFVFYIPPLIISEVLGKLSRGVGPSDTGDLLISVGMLALSMLIGELLWRVGLDVMTRFQCRALAYVSRDSFEHLTNKTLRFHADTFAGALVNKASRLITNVIQVHDTLVFNINDTIIGFAVVGIILIPRAPIVYAAFCVVMGLFVVLVRPQIRARSKLVKRRTRAESAQIAALADALTNITAIKAFARGDHESELFAKVTERRRKLTEQAWLFQIWRVDMVISPSYVAVNAISLAAAVLAITRFGAPLETVFLSYTYVAFLSRKMWEFNRVWRNLETYLSEAANGLEVIRAGVELKDVNPSEGKVITKPKGLISFRDVEFQYHDSHRTLFSKLNLEIKPGEKVGLVGPSGGGKTTVVKLIMRFIDVTNGRVEVDDIDVRDMTQKELRRHIAYVPQEPVLFHRSIMENIRYGDLEASDSAVKKAAQLAHASEFIDHLSNGYDTLVGERGVKLSGGQRQRIAIARAMLRKSPILVLDEATSALDSKSEKYIAEALDHLMEGRTTIVIAHRLSTIRRLDRIIVIDKGRIVEEGTHDKLLEKHSKYHELWTHQSGDFIR